MPSQLVDIVRRLSPWARRRWLLDAVVGLLGPEWDRTRGVLCHRPRQDSVDDLTTNNLLPEQFDTDRTRFLAERDVMKEEIALDEAIAAHANSISPSARAAGRIRGHCAAPRPATSPVRLGEGVCF